jgi:hypothetical protein
VREQTACAPVASPALAGEFDQLSCLALAAGKDFNDELTLILNHAAASRELLGPEHPAGRGLEELQHAAIRCAEISRCLLLLTLRARDAMGCVRVKAGRAHSGN